MVTNWKFTITNKSTNKNSLIEKLIYCEIKMTELMKNYFKGDCNLSLTKEQMLKQPQSQFLQY